MIELPVVDLTPFRTDPHSAAAADTVADLVAAAHEIGFVYLTGHGVDPALDANIFGAARAASSNCLKMTAERWPSRTVQPFAGTRCSVTR